MADLIAKVARKQEPLPSIRTTQSRRAAGGSPLRDLMRSASQSRPLPPVRTAVSFRAWGSSDLGGPDSSGLGLGGALRPLPDSKDTVVTEHVDVVQEVMAGEPGISDTCRTDLA